MPATILATSSVSLLRRLFPVLGLAALTTSVPSLAEDVAVQDVVSPDGKVNTQPTFTGVTVSGLTGLFYMPTSGRLNEGQARLAIAVMHPSERGRDSSLLFPSEISGDVLRSLVTVRVGNRVEIAVGKDKGSEDGETFFANQSLFKGSLDQESEFVAIKFTQPLSRKGGYFLNLAYDSATDRAFSPVFSNLSGRTKSYYATVSKVDKNAEWTVGYKKSKSDLKVGNLPWVIEQAITEAAETPEEEAALRKALDLQTSHTDKSHQYGIGAQYQVTEELVLHGEFWQKPKDEDNEEAETMFGVRYKPSERLELYGGMANTLDTDSAEPYFGLAYITRFQGKKADAPTTSSTPAPAATPAAEALAPPPATAPVVAVAE